jgi:indole-3-glycerol phosphate synthase
MSRDFLEKMYGLSRRRAEELAAPTDAGPPVRSFKAALLSPGMAVIAEVKYATPADGMLGVGDTPDVIAREYERLGAAAISCLTEPEYFAGRLEYLAMVRSSCSLPVMMKDFIVDERQIIAGRSFGADAVLLVTEMLCLEELRALYACAQDLGMGCLVEIHGPEGLDKALAVGANIIGVNCRDLRTLQVDARRHEELVADIPARVIKVGGEWHYLGYEAQGALRCGLRCSAHRQGIRRKGTEGGDLHVGQDLRHNQA